MANVEKAPLGTMGTIIARQFREGHIRLGNRLAAQSEERFSQEMWRREADCIACLCQETQFRTSYQFFFPPGAIEAVFSHYGIIPSSPNLDESHELELQHANLPIFRRLISHLASSSTLDEEGSFFRRHPLPHQSFLVTGATADLFDHLWAESVPTFFTGRVSPNFLPQRVFRGVGQSEFVAKQKRLFSTYRQRHPNLDCLVELDPGLICCLEAYYFQGKPVSQIAQEQQIKRGRVYVNKELGLVALGIKQGSKGEAARRYKFWLGPVLQRWEENKKYIAGLPPALQEMAWEFFKGVSAKTVAQRFGVSYRDTMPLRQQLLSGVVEREPFLSQRRCQAIEELFTLPFNQQPIAQLTQAVLEAKAEGKTYPEIREILGLDYRQVSYLLRGGLEDLQWAFPDSPDIPPMSRKRLLILPRPGQQLSFLYRRFTAEMVQSGRHLTPRQEKFLEQAQTNLPFAEGGFLALYLKSLKSRWTKREERIGLAKAALRKPANFSPEDQERVRKIAQRTPVSRIFPRGVRDPEFLRLYRQMRQLREAA